MTATPPESGGPWGPKRPASPSSAGAETQGGALADAVAALAAALRADQRESEKLARRHRRRAFWWRLIAVVLIVGAISSMFLGGPSGSSDHIARVAVSGVILDDPKRDALLAKLTEDDAVKAVVVRIDSPGGTTVGGEALYESLRLLSEEKPVVAVMGEVAASAAYIAALATDRIVARGNTITASVGVILTAPNFHGVLESVGVEVLELKSGEQKAEPSPFQPLDRTALGSQQAMIDDSFEWFLGLVRERRSAPVATIQVISDGRTLNGRMAQALGLVDDIGGEREAVAWLEAERDVAAGLPIRDRKVAERQPGLIGQVLDRLLGGDGPASVFTGLGPQIETVLRGPVLTSAVGAPAK